MNAGGSRVLKLAVAENAMIARGIFRLRFSLPDDYGRPEPGQFVNVYLNDESRMLPRPLSVCDWEPGALTLAYAVAGKGTEILSRYKPGTVLRVSTPLGNGFASYGEGCCVLIGGGLGIAPLLYLSKNIPAGNQRAVLGFRSEVFLTGEFPCPADVATGDGTAGFHGNAVELLREIADANAQTADETGGRVTVAERSGHTGGGIFPGAKLFACGPRPMLQALAVFARERGLDLRVSLEERMGCGYGACVGCTCKTVNGNRKVCEDGPVFNASEVIWNA